MKLQVLVLSFNKIIILDKIKQNLFTASNHCSIVSNTGLKILLIVFIFPFGIAMKSIRSTKKYLLYFILFGSIFGLILAAIFTENLALSGVTGNQPFRLSKNISSNEICKTPACIVEASNVLKWMDPSVDPCDNFYKFACGNYYNSTNIKDHTDSIDNFILNSNVVSKKIKIAIENSITEKDPKVFKLSQAYYNRCMDSEKIEKTSENEFREILKELGGWPVLDGDSWDESTFDWRKTVYKLHKLGYTMINLIEFIIDVDLKNNSRKIIYLGQPKLGLLNQILTYSIVNSLELTSKNYLEYMLDFVQLFGVPREQARAELNELLTLEVELTEIFVHDRTRDIPYNLMSLGELQSKYPNFTWIEYFNGLLDHHEQVELTDEIVIESPTYPRFFNNYISQIPKRVIANYLMWNVAIESIDYLSERVQNARRNFINSFGLISSEEPRWKVCIKDLKRSLPTGTKALYVRKHFHDEEVRGNVIEMVENLKKSFRNSLNKIEWLDEKTKNLALEKIEYMEAVVAYPNEYLDDKKLDGYYYNLRINCEKSYLRNKLGINLFNRAYVYENLRKAYNRTSWINFKWSVTANYHMQANAMEITAPFLQGMFYSKYIPQYINYGRLGMIIGHELTHGFDNKGIHFDKTGNYEEWWESESKKKFFDRALCLVYQYGLYTVKEVDEEVDGEKTLDENIADNAGVKHAYHAYNEWEKRNNKVEPQLPGLNYTSQQMFWINTANSYCSKDHPNRLRFLMNTDPHSPKEIRVNGALRNLPEFSKDFNCPVESRMNPPKKCVVW